MTHRLGRALYSRANPALEPLDYSSQCRVWMQTEPAAFLPPSLTNEQPLAARYGKNTRIFGIKHRG